jgi:hypothetical protein
MNVFFDVDYTILSQDDTLRSGTAEVFARLRADGHGVYVWSGMGPRWKELRRHHLDHLVDGVFSKPVFDYVRRLETLGVDPIPDFVVDDHPGPVYAFGGMLVPGFCFREHDDDRMEQIYGVISQLAATGACEHPDVHRRPG